MLERGAFLLVNERRRRKARDTLKDGYRTAHALSCRCGRTLTAVTSLLSGRNLMQKGGIIRPSPNEEVRRLGNHQEN